MNWPDGGRQSDAARWIAFLAGLGVIVHESLGMGERKWILGVGALLMGFVPAKWIEAVLLGRSRNGNGNSDGQHRKGGP